MCKLQAIDKGLLVTKFLRLFNMMTAIDIKMQTDLLTHLVPVADQGGEHLADRPLHQDPAHHAEALAVTRHALQRLDHDLVLVQVLLQLVGLARDLPLLVPHGVEHLDDLLLRLLVLHPEQAVKI